MKDKNSFSIRNKDEKDKENPINTYKANKPNLNEKISDYKINKKTIASISTSYPHKNISSTLSNIKPFFSYKEVLNKAYTKLNKELHSYNISNEQFNKKIINEIIFDENKKIVSIFKDYLLWYETSDFFKCYYKMDKSTLILKKFIEYYEEYTHCYPEYGPLEEFLNILQKNIRRKKKYVKNYIKEEKNDSYKKEENFDRLIKESEIKESELKSKNSCFNSYKTNSKSTLNLNSMENGKNINIDNNNNKDLYNILKAFIDYDEITNCSKDLSNSNILNQKENLENIFIINPKLNKNIKKSFNEEKSKEINKDKNIIINNNYKKSKPMSPNINILNDIIHQKIGSKTKEEQILKINEKGKNYKNISLRKKFINPLLKIVNQTSKISANYKHNESNSNSKVNKYNTIKYDKKTYLVKKNPQNIKKLFNSYNKYENHLFGNYYTILSYRKIKGNKSKKSPKSVINNSPLNSKTMINTLILNTLNYKKRIKNKNILNFEKIKKINSIKNTHRTNNNSEIENNKDSHYRIKSNKIFIKFKSNKFSKKFGKAINLFKKNNNTKIITSTHNSKENSLSKRRKEKKNLIKKNFHITNQFKKDNSNSIVNSSINPNPLSISINPNKLYTNQKRISSIMSYNSIKEDINNYLIKNRLKRAKNSLILFNLNLSNLGKNFLTNSFKKKNNDIISNNSFLIKKFKNIKSKNKLNINLKSNKISNKPKNNVVKKTIDKSFSRNELNEKIKNNQNTLLKSCFLNKNNNLEKKNFFIFEDIDKTNFTNKNYINKFSILNSNENNLIKNKIKKRADLNSSKNGPKRTKISLKMPMINNINKI